MIVPVSFWNETQRSKKIWQIPDLLGIKRLNIIQGPTQNKWSYWQSLRGARVCTETCGFFQQQSRLSKPWLELFFLFLNPTEFWKPERAPAILLVCQKLVMNYFRGRQRVWQTGVRDNNLISNLWIINLKWHVTLVLFGILVLQRTRW